MAKLKDNKIILSETEIKNQIKSYLKKLHPEIFWWSNSSSVFGKKGIPDIEGIHPKAGHIWIEVKRLDGKLSSHQARFINILETYGEKVLIAHSLDDVIEWLEKLCGPASLGIKGKKIAPLKKSS